VNTEFTRYLRDRAAFDVQWAEKADGSVPVPPDEPPPPPPPSGGVIRVPEDLPFHKACEFATTGTVIDVGGTVDVTEPARLGGQTESAPNAPSAIRIIGRGNGATLVNKIPAELKGGFLGIVSKNVTIEGIAFDGRFGPRKCIKSFEVATGLKISHSSATQFSRHCWDLDGAFIVEDCDINHVLWFEAGKRIDAHGIVTMQAKTGVIRRCKIGQCSGDSFQLDRATRGAAWRDNHLDQRPDDMQVIGNLDDGLGYILIEDCDFYDAPLEEAMAGANAGDLCQENGIDVKGTFGSRRRTVVRNTRFHGFDCSYSVSMAAVLLSESNDVLLDRVSVYDSAIGLRLRGYDDSLRMRLKMTKCTVSDCETALLGEDKLDSWMLHDSLIERCPTVFKKGSADSEPWTFKDWDIRRNAVKTAQTSWPVPSGDRAALGGVTMIAYPIPPVVREEGILKLDYESNVLVAE
jgi:hypothetical protein